MKIIDKLMLIGVVVILCAGCERQPTQPDASPQIKIAFKSVDHPSQPTLFTPWIKPAGRVLAKPGSLVKDQVLMLHCDEDSAFGARDASAYANHATLYNVTRVASANEALKQALNFSGAASYATLPWHGELKATQSLEIGLWLSLSESAVTGEQRIVDCHDLNGGYTLGVLGQQLYFRVKQDGLEITVRGTTALVPNRWYKVVARFESGSLVLLLDDKTDGTDTFAGPISPSQRQVVIGAGHSDLGIAYNLLGRLDEISITTTVEYVDLDMVRIVVIDLAQFTSPDSLHYSARWQAYTENEWKFFSDTTSAPTWTAWKNLWSKYFTILSDRELTVRGGFAEGTILGADGLNMLAVGGIRNGEIMFYGFGYAFALKNQVVETMVELWQVED